MFLPIHLHRISKNKIILILLAIFSTLIVILTPLISYSTTVQDIPNPRRVNGGWVSDHANILSPATEAQLNKLLWQLKTNTGAEFAVVTVPNTSSASSPKEFTTELFNYWGIGEKGKDNGLLWLHSVGDRRLEIETGYGLEGILPDARIGNIIRNEIIPKFKANDFNGGTLTGVQSLSKIITNQLKPALPAGQPKVLPVLPDKNLPASQPTILPVLPDETLPASQPEIILQGEHIILLAIAFLLGAIAYFRAESLAKTPIYVSQVDIQQNQTEDNSGIYFLLWLASFMIILAIASLISIIYFHTVNPIIVGLASTIIALLPIKPLTYPIDQNRQSRSLHPIYCEKCREPMVRLDDQIIMNTLNKHQKTALKLGSIAFEGWQCEKCLNHSKAQIIDLEHLDHQDIDHQDTKYSMKSVQKKKNKQLIFHLRRYVLNSHWSMCPHGQELTVKNSSHIAVQPTRYSTGLKIVSHVCQCCDYRNEEHHILPTLPEPSSSSSSYDSSDSGGSSGGSDFGGGSSGGGGAGDSY